ncbi:MAG: Ig-like domain-containing protein, partial [Candidatus Latescibacteria bacterium]|nr:Ig-like domain-containing protein [Candidatus Latescibacterota bacterium]
MFVFIGLSCAKQGYPPGGPDDRIPPRLISSTPQAFSTGVPRDGPIVMEFSESMNTRSVEDNLFIVPIPAVQPQIEWKSRDRKLLIRFGGPLLGDATYVISVGTKARDLRNNQLDEAILLSFSTGGEIENRKIRGKVIPATFAGESRENVSGIDVAAFRMDGSDGGPDPRKAIPAFVTQSGGDGSFEMIGLSRGTYRLFAIGDEDRNGFYSEGYDMIGIASSDVVLTGSDSLVVAPDIAVTERDTSHVQLVSIAVPDGRRVELYFDRPVLPRTAEIAFTGLDIVDMFVPDDRRSMVSVATEKQEKGKRYPLERLEVSDRDGNRLMPFEVIPYFQGVDTPDTTSLAVTSVSPELLGSREEQVTFTFNRALSLPGSPGDVLATEPPEDVLIHHPAANVITVEPGEKWREGTAYRVMFDPGSVTGIAGNRLT